MNVAELRPSFEERLNEVQVFLSLLHDIEQVAAMGPPRLEHATRSITAEQLRILYSTTYLQLYNLVESTITSCMRAIDDAVSSTGTWRVDDLTTEIRREWVRAKARTHVVLAPDTRLNEALKLCDHIVDCLPVNDLAVERGGGGNWDDQEIESMSTRLGCSLQFGKGTLTAVRRHRADKDGALALVKRRRNDLAHGSISFVSCSDGVSVSDLTDVVDAIGNYLGEAVDSFVAFITGLHFVLPERRVAGGLGA
jgi:hypothetical protein